MAFPDSPSYSLSQWPSPPLSSHLGSLTTPPNLLVYKPLMRQHRTAWNAHIPDMYHTSTIHCKCFMSRYLIAGRTAEVGGCSSKHGPIMQETTLVLIATYVCMRLRIHVSSVCMDLGFSLWMWEDDVIQYVSVFTSLPYLCKESMS